MTQEIKKCQAEVAQALLEVELIMAAKEAVVKRAIAWCEAGQRAEPAREAALLKITTKLGFQFVEAMRALEAKQRMLAIVTQEVA